MNRCKTVIMVLGLFLTAAAGASVHNLGESESADGTRIVYEVWGEGAPTLVFIHGWSCDRRYWREQVESFAENHRVIAVDLAGHGDSAAGRDDYTMKAFGADVVAVLEAADIDDAILVGHSMGGPVAVEAALRAPDRVRAIVGVDNFQSFAEELPQAQVDAFIAAIEQNFVYMVDGWVRGMIPASADSSLREEISADMAAGDPKVGISAMRNVLHWMSVAGAARVEKLKANITTISSDMRPTNVEANRELVPGFEVRIIEGVGHFPMLEAPARFNELLAEAVASS